MTDTPKARELLERLAWQPRHEREVLKEAFRIVAERRYRDLIADRAAKRQTTKETT